MKWKTSNYYDVANKDIFLIDDIIDTGGLLLKRQKNQRTRLQNYGNVHTRTV